MAAVLAGARAALALAASALALAASAPVDAQSASRVRVALTQGTNVALDLAPDGRALAFDLLGRIWVLPVEGGMATPLTDPLGDARQPRWSPDGARIAFQAYWDGNYHVWSVSRAGTDLRQHTRGPYDHREPDWSPDGASIVVSSDRGGGYDVWTLNVADGTLTRVAADPATLYAPAFSPEGTRIAFAAEGEGKGGVWVAPAEPGREMRRVAAVGDGARANAPSWDVDGAALAYNVVDADRSQLLWTRVADAAEPRVLSADGEDVFPFRAAFGPDGLYYTADGRVLHRGRDGGGAREIPFSAVVELDRPPYERRPRDLSAPGPLPVRGVVSPAVSPDGRQVAFVALGDLWIRNEGGDLDRVTSDAWIETDPAWSPSGRELAFSSDREGALDLYVWDEATRRIERVTHGVGAVMPSWSPDGERIAFVTAGYRVRIGVLDLATGAVETLRAGLNGAGRPSWSPDGRSVVTSVHWPYSRRFREGVNRALALPTDGLRAAEDEEPAMDRDAPSAGGGWAGSHAHGEGEIEFELRQGERFLNLNAHGSIGARGTDGPVRSPDGRWLAYVADGVLWAVATDADGDPTERPPVRLTDGPAEDPTWTGDSRSIVHLAGARLRRVDVRDGSVHDLPLDLEWTRAASAESLLIRAASLWDGASDELRHDVDVLVEDGRIVEVADRGAGRGAARVVVADGVLMPGLIEMHAHFGIADGERLGRAWLSYGVTSVRCPACDPYEIAEAKEAGESGRRRAPRWFGTGATIDGGRVYYPGAPTLGSTAQVSLELGRAADLGYDLIKTYVRLADPVQARVVRDAHALGVPVTSHELYPAVAFGADGVEHVRGTSRRGYSTKVSELYRSYGDVVDLLAASGMTLTPTIGIYGAFALLARDDPAIFADARVDAFFPGAAEEARAAPDVERTRGLVEAMASLPRRVVEAGGRVVAGTDAPIVPPGLGFVAELEAMVRYGGMEPLDVLRSATLESGRALGYPGLLGVVEPGAFADLIVVDGDPIEDVRALRDVRLVIQGGVARDVESLLRPPS